MLGGGLGMASPEQMESKLESTKKLIEEVTKQFANPVRPPNTTTTTI